jgi:hypothetical protein
MGTRSLKYLGQREASTAPLCVSGCHFSCVPFNAVIVGHHRNRDSKIRGLLGIVFVCRLLLSFVAIRLTSSKEPSQMDFFDLDFIRWTMTFRRGTISLELPPITLAPESLATAYSPLLSPTAQPAPTFPYYNNPWFGNGLPSGRAS